MEQLKVSSNVTKMQQVFGKRLYANKYSFISEICQNAVDSHRMAGVKEPVIVGLRNGPGVDYVFYVKDVGLSFDSKQQFLDLICTILESGKDENKTESEDCPMGEHGIGSISVSAYCDKWKYTVVKDNRLFVANLREVEGKGLTHDIDMNKLDEYDHSYDEKYVLFEVPVPVQDLANFIIQMKDKLAYFKDILFEFDTEVLKVDKNLLLLNTQFKLYEGDDFMLSTLSRNTHMHIALDQYSYPIRWNELGIPAIKCNVALKFHKAEGLRADLTRENLQFTDDYKEVITEKIRKVCQWFMNRYNDKIPDEFESFKALATAYKETKAVRINEMVVDVSNMQFMSGVNYKQFKFKGVSDEVLGKFIEKTNSGELLFKCESEINHNGIREAWKSTSLSESGCRILYKDPIKSRVLRYLKENYKGYGLHRKNKIPLFAKEGISYNFILNLRHNKGHMAQIYKASGVNIWREKIKMFQILEDVVTKEYFVNIDKIIAGIPSGWGRRAPLKVNRKTKEQVGIKYAVSTQRNANWNCKFVEKTLEISDLQNQPHFHVYGTVEQRDKLDNLYVITNIKYSVIPCIMTERHIAKIEKLNLHNFMSIDEYLKGKHDTFKKIATAHFINKDIFEANKKIINDLDIIKKHICSKFANDVESLESYKNKYYSFNNWIRPDTFFMLAFEQVALDLKLYDLEVWEKYQNVKNYIKRFDFIDYFSSQIRLAKGDEFTRALTAIHDIAKYRKIRMNWEHYTLLDMNKSDESGNDTNNGIERGSEEEI